jgi:hypothetical protein
MSAAIVAILLGLAVARAEDPFAWTEPSPEEQLARDRLEIPVGKGALFVPSITGSLNEPPVILVDPAGEISDLRTGERTLVPPGTYTVIVSSGSPGQGVGQVVEVEEGETALVPVIWGALRVEVVDDHRVPHRGGYEILRADTREPYGTGFGADTLQGETLNTWLLPPGLYQVVRPGSSYRALRDFATVYIPEGGLVRYRLVTDPDTGEFQGAGVILPGEFGSAVSQEHRVLSSIVLGGTFSLSQEQALLNQTALDGAVFLDGQVGYTRGKNVLTGLLQIEEGISQVRPRGLDPLPLIKTRDRLSLSTLYLFYARPSLGPYVRAAGESSAFETRGLATEDTTIVKTFDTHTTTEVVAASDTWFLADPWEPTILREGTGLNTRIVNNRWVTFNFRLGLGLRQNRYGGAFLLEDIPTTSAIEYQEVDSFDQQGFESTIVASARLPGWAVYATDVELFADFRELAQPSVEWRNTVTLRVTRNLSVNYFLNLDHLPLVVDTLQFEQSVLLRASWALL